VLHPSAGFSVFAASAIAAGFQALSKSSLAIVSSRRRSVSQFGSAPRSSQRLNANRVVSPSSECIPSHWLTFAVVTKLTGEIEGI
jgi:hypothetical protein